MAFHIVSFHQIYNTLSNNKSARKLCRSLRRRIHYLQRPMKNNELCKIIAHVLIISWMQLHDTRARMSSPNPKIWINNAHLHGILTISASEIAYSRGHLTLLEPLYCLEPKANIVLMKPPSLTIPGWNWFNPEKQNRPSSPSSCMWMQSYFIPLA